MKIGDKFIIHSYKHNGNIHRAWDEAVLLEENPDYLVFGNNQTLVTEADGRTWNTKEPAIIYFYNNRWFNIICQFKDDGIYYYCNMASPFLIEDGAVKYIDYDLDLRVFADNTYKILDKSEYKYHKEKMEYPQEPYPLKEKEQIDEDTEALMAKVYMNNMVRAGRNWGKHKEVSDGRIQS